MTCPDGGNHETVIARALILGSLGTLADLADLQRRAANLAFSEAGVEMSWDMTAFARAWSNPSPRARMGIGGRDGEALDRLRRTHFSRLLEREGAMPRPGLRRIVQAAQAAGAPVALASTAHPDEVDAVLDALSPRFRADALGWIGDRSRVAGDKPAPDIYVAAVTALGVPAEASLAVEDRPATARAALSAGLRVMALPEPGAAQAADFPAGILIADSLHPAHLRLAGTLPGGASRG